MTSDDEATAGPFAGVLVADFGRVLAGPYCTMLMADLGATVIKVESPLGDETRSWLPPERDGEATYFLSVNRNKRSIALDFREPNDLELAKALAARADVITENFKPGGLAPFGLDYESVAQVNEDVIYASITGFGSLGADLPGYDLLVQGLSGLMSLTGSPETAGFRAGVAVFDVITGLHAGLAVSAALYHRAQTGRGQKIELDLMTSALSGMVNQTGGYLLSGKTPTRMGNDHPSIYPYAPFPTADGDIILAIGNDRQFRALCLALGNPDLAAQTIFATNVARSAHRNELREELVRLLAWQTANEWFESLTSAGVPCAPVLDVGAGIAFAERIGLDPVVYAGSPDRMMPSIRNPMRFSRTPASYRHAPPRLDEHGDEVREWLRAGISRATS